MEKDDKKDVLREKYSKRKESDRTLDKDRYYEVQNDKESKYDYVDSTSITMSKKSKIIVAVSVVLAVAIAFGVIFGKKYYQMSQEMKRADNLQSLGNYDEAEEIYNKLYLATGDKKYKEKIEYNDLLKYDDGVMEMGISNFESENYAQAIDEFTKIKDEDKKNYKSAQEYIENSKKKAFIKLDQYLRDKNTIDAKIMTKDLQLFFPEDERLKGYEKKVKVLEESLERESENKTTELLNDLMSSSDTKKDYDDSNTLEKMHKRDRRVVEEACAMIKDSFNNITAKDRKSTRLNSSHANISYAVFCLKKKNKASPFHYVTIASTATLYSPRPTLQPG